MSNPHDDDSMPGKFDEDFLRDAVRNARARHSRGYQPRWVAVMETFATGTAYAQTLCRRFGFDPDEKVRS